MSAVYLDTSALFKHYVEEDESEDVTALIADSRSVGTALITRVEVAAALAKAVRDDRMERAEARAVERTFTGDWAAFIRVGLTDGLLTKAGELAWRHGLRGYDAVQLAAALTWREVAGEAEEEMVFACFDNDLRRAAAAEGLTPWPV